MERMNCLTCSMSQYCGTMVGSLRLCKAMREQEAWEAYLQEWLLEMSNIPEEEMYN